MPELPEVETVRRGLEPVMEGQIIREVSLHRAGLRTAFAPDMADRLKGRKIAKLTRRAKYLLIHLGKRGPEDDVLVIHLGMSGRMSVIDDAKTYERKKHDHLMIYLKSGKAVAFNDARRFGMAFIVKEKDLGAHPAFKSLGPEPLGGEFTGKVLHEKLKGKKTAIKLALLDQRIVSGIGNIYACEALFEAGIDPRKAAGEITLAKAGLLVESIRSVLNKSIKAGGSSLKDYRHADGGLGYFQHSFSVYGKEGQLCPCAARKKAVIEKITQGGRSTFWCPGCQT